MSDDYLASELVDTLQNTGFHVYRRLKNKKGEANGKSFQKTFENHKFRLLELIRQGKRDEVFYSLLRLFTTYGQKIPKPVSDAFNPKFSDDLFKVMMFSFLGGLLGEEEVKESNSER
jgi:hypothetical protein